MKNRNIRAFLLAPLVPALFFSIVAALSVTENLLAGSETNVLLSFYIWLTYAIPSSYIVAIILGVPVYFILDYKNIKTMTMFSLTSAIIGGGVGIFIHILFGANELTEHFIGLILGAILGLMAGCSFWGLSKTNPTKENE